MSTGVVSFSSSAPSGVQSARSIARYDAEPGLQPRDPQAKACAPGCNIDSTNSNTAPTWTNHPNALRPIESQQVQTNSATQFINVADEMSPSRRTYNPSTSAAGDTEAIAAKGRLVLINGATPTVLTQVTAYPSELFSHRNPTYNENTIALPSDRGSLEISGTNLMYEGTRVKTWLLGRDLNPGGRGFGNLYPHGMFNIGQLRPTASDSLVLGIGNSVNNGPPPFGSDCSWSVGECRPMGGDGLDTMCLVETCIHVFEDKESECAKRENEFSEEIYNLDPLRKSGTGWCVRPISGSCYTGGGKQTVTMFALFNGHDERCAGYNMGWLMRAMADGGSGGNGGGGCPGCGGAKPPIPEKKPCIPAVGGVLPPGPPPGVVGPMWFYSSDASQPGKPKAFDCDNLTPEERLKVIDAVKKWIDTICKWPIMSSTPFCKAWRKVRDLQKFIKSLCECYNAITGVWGSIDDEQMLVCKAIHARANSGDEAARDCLFPFELWCDYECADFCECMRDAGMLGTMAAQCSKDGSLLDRTAGEVLRKCGSLQKAIGEGKSSV